MMLVHFLDYVTATGAIRGFSAIPDGALMLQPPPLEGRSRLIVPAAMSMAADIDMPMLRAALIQRLTDEVTGLWATVATPGLGQLYRAKEAEALALLSNGDAAAPIIRAEAAALGCDPAERGALILARVAQASTLATLIEPIRHAAIAAIGAADTPEAALVAGTIPWATALNPETTDAE